jgi:hypothetical protein
MQSLDSALIDLCYQTHRELVYGHLQFQKRSKDFIGAHDIAFSVAVRTYLALLIDV